MIVTSLETMLLYVPPPDKSEMFMLYKFFLMHLSTAYTIKHILNTGSQGCGKAGSGGSADPLKIWS